MRCTSARLRTGKVAVTAAFSLRSRASSSSTTSSTVPVARIESKFGMGRRLVVAVDAGQAMQIARRAAGRRDPSRRAPRTPRPAWPRAPRRTERRARSWVRAHRVACRRIRRHHRGEHEHAVAGEQLRRPSRCARRWRRDRRGSTRARATARPAPRRRRVPRRAVPSARSRSARAVAIVVLPALGSPVSHTVAPSAGRARGWTPPESGEQSLSWRVLLRRGHGTRTRAGS